jgi:hypothetical protein
MELTSIEPVDVRAPALQTQLIAAEFLIVVDKALFDELVDRVQAFLAATEVMRDRRGKAYNLRPLVQALSLERESDRVVIRSRLQSTDSGTGRPDELARALGLDPALVRMHRTRLIFQFDPLTNDQTINRPVDKPL